MYTYICIYVYTQSDNAQRVLHKSIHLMLPKNMGNLVQRVGKWKASQVSQAGIRLHGSTGGVRLDAKLVLC
jgi:hypothetical protein